MAKTKGWTAQDIPDQTGRSFVVTGGNSGLGFETSKALAARGAHVVLACRNPAKAQAALDEIRKAHPDASVESLALDLASLSSVRDFAKTLLDRVGALHGLVNNAGVMALPKRETADGFEMQLGTNHLGHFALTGLLIERLLASDGARIVNVSSTAHRVGRMNFEDLQSKRSYSRWPAYGQSKLANLLFTLELDRRLRARGADLLCAASHPGYAATNLQFAGPQMEGATFMERAMGLSNRLFSQTAEMGALPSLFAATAPGVEGGDYYGPDGFAEVAGHPKKVARSARARNAEDAARLWDVSTSLTGVTYEALENGTR